MLNEIKKDAQTRMAKSVEAFRHDLTKVRTGRASIIGCCWPAPRARPAFTCC